MKTLASSLFSKMVQAVRMKPFNVRTLFLTCFLFMYSNFFKVAFAQVPAKLQTISMRKAVDQLAANFQVNFIYESSLLSGKIVELKDQQLKDKRIEVILSELLKPHSIAFYKVDSKNYALFSVLDSANDQQLETSPNTFSAFKEERFSISGLVLERSGKPLEYSSVYLLANDTLRVAGTIADSLGRYKFLMVNEGNYRIEVTRMGYQSIISALFKFANAHDDVQPSLVLDEAPKRLRQVFVTSLKPVFEYHSDRTLINVQGSFTGVSFSVNDLLQISPGVKLENDQFSIRGKQGVMVLMDGSPIKLPHQQLMNLLKGIPISSVSQIELIHAPSARYDAQDQSGAINIKMLNNQHIGLNGSISSLFSVGTRARFTQNATVNFSSEKISFFGNYSFQKLHSESEFLSKNFINITLPTAYQQEQTGSSSDIIHSGLLGATYQINRRNNISIKGTLVKEINSSKFDRSLFLKKLDKVSPDSSIASMGQNLPDLRSQTVNFSSNHTLGKENHQLSFYADYIAYRSKVREHYRNTYVSLSGEIVGAAEELRNNTTVELDLFFAGLDYTFVLNKKHQLEAGAKLAFTNSDSRALFQYENLNGQLLTDYSRTNSFFYKEKISSAYLNYQGKIGMSTNLQLGVRGENTNYITAAIAGDQTTDQNYLQLFPNLLVSHGLRQHNFTFSYRRSLARPSYQDLNPFVTYFSPFHYAVGNQFLRPETTHSLAVGYSYGMVMNLSFGYNRTQHNLTTLVFVDEGSLTTRQSIGNFGNYELFRLSMDYQKKMLKSWKLAANASLFHDRFTHAYLGNEIKNSLLGFDFNIKNSFQIRSKLTLELLQLYQSKRARLAGFDFGRYRADAALNYALFNGRTDLRLGITDIFYTYLDQGESHLGQLHSTFVNKNENRRFHIGISYVFGQNEIKTKTILSNQEAFKRIK